MSGIRGVTVGRTIPDCWLAEYVGDEVRPKMAREALAGQRALVVGVSSAFTPDGTAQHVSSLIGNADHLKASGFDAIYCVVATDPFATRAWAEQIDPEGKVKFWSDGNLEFARAFGLISMNTKLFLGERSERYLMTLRRARVESVRIEHSTADFSGARPETFVLQKA
jgi:2-Cys peroxiredoxin 5